MDGNLTRYFAFDMYKQKFSDGMLFKQFSFCLVGSISSKLKVLAMNLYERE